jgi:phage tail-like protein
MRGVIAGLASPVPFIDRLPAVLQDDEFLGRFLSAFDDAVAPVFVTLDGLAGYVDPRLAPPDFLEWLGSWVGIEFEANWSDAQRRDAVVRAVSIHARRGTLAGVTNTVQLAVGDKRSVSVSDNGGVSWSKTPGAALPGDPNPRLTVVIGKNRLTPDLTRVDALVMSSKPAHIPHTVSFAPDSGVGG